MTAASNFKGVTYFDYISRHISGEVGRGRVYVTVNRAAGLLRLAGLSVISIAVELVCGAVPAHDRETEPRPADGDVGPAAHTLGLQEFGNAGLIVDELPGAVRLLADQPERLARYCRSNSFRSRSPPHPGARRRSHPSPARSRRDRRRLLELGSSQPLSQPRRVCLRPAAPEDRGVAHHRRLSWGGGRGRGRTGLGRRGLPQPWPAQRRA